MNPIRQIGVEKSGEREKAFRLFFLPHERP